MWPDSSAANCAALRPETADTEIAATWSDRNASRLSEENALSCVELNAAICALFSALMSAVFRSCTAATERFRIWVTVRLETIEVMNAPLMVC